MARIRSIKPEIRTSEKVNAWPVEVRYFWIMLWGYVDDHGRGRDNPKLIVADTYPLDDEVSHKDVERWLRILERDGVIHRYKVDEKPYLLVLNWSEHQKPSHPARSVIPEPETVPDKGREGFCNPPEGFARTSANGSPEQRAGSREQGAEEQGAEPAARDTDAGFEEAYDAYPLKRDRKKARAAYIKALKDASHEVILEGIHRYRDDPNRDPKYTKHPATWFNGGCWDDDPLPARGTTNRSTDRMMAGYQAMAGYNGPTDDPWQAKELEA